jgi:hypothetical protein
VSGRSLSLTHVTTCSQGWDAREQWVLAERRTAGVTYVRMHSGATPAPVTTF